MLGRRARAMFELLRHGAEHGCRPWARIWTEDGLYWNAIADYFDAHVDRWRQTSTADASSRAIRSGIRTAAGAGEGDQHGRQADGHGHGQAAGGPDVHRGQQHDRRDQQSAAGDAHHGSDTDEAV